MHKTNWIANWHNYEDFWKMVRNVINDFYSDGLYEALETRTNEQLIAEMYLNDEIYYAETNWDDVDLEEEVAVRSREDEELKWVPLSKGALETGLEDARRRMARHAELDAQERARRKAWFGKLMEGAW